MKLRHISFKCQKASFGFQKVLAKIVSIYNRAYQPRIAVAIWTNEYKCMRFRADTNERYVMCHNFGFNYNLFLVQNWIKYKFIEWD